MRLNAGSRQGVARNYDRMSWWYGAVAGTGESGLREAALRLFAAQAGEAVLEIGYGSGQSILRLAEAVGDSGKACGIDISGRMLSVATRRAAAAGMAGRVELRCADALPLPYGDSVFDGVFMSFTLEVFSPQEMDALLRECRRVLKPSGRVCVVAMSSQGKRTTMMRLYGWAHARMPKVVDCRPICAAEALCANGFRIKAVKLSSLWGLSVETVQAKR